MKIRVKVLCNTEESNNIVSELNGKCKATNIIKGGVIVDPVVNETGEFVIDSVLRKYNHILLIDITERGGQSDVTDYAQVVSGLTGKALRPYFIPRKNVQFCGDHAYFSIPESCVLITSEKEIVNILKVTIEDNKETNIAKLITENLYSGALENLTEENLRFKLAAEIAVDKSNCKNCTHVHYYVDTNTFNNIKKAA